MKRRKLLIAGSAALASPAILTSAWGQTADPSRLDSDELTPLGSERAASKSGLVPAWTGGISTPPAGWSPGMYPPDLFPGEQPIFTITTANQDKYADLICDGQRMMLKRFGAAGYRIDVFPSHRPACAPKYVYDNIKLNVTRAQPADAGLTYGVKGVIGGIPFAIPSSDPNIAGAQIMTNHLLRWNGAYFHAVESDYVVGSGARVLTSCVEFWMRAPYYIPGMTVEEFERQNVYLDEYVENLAPANQVGGKILAKYTTNVRLTPDTSYEYLQGLGRIRQLPGTEYDIPCSEFDDALNYDELFLWNGSLDRYTWKSLGKKEMVVQYNQYKMGMGQVDEVLGLEFVSPDFTRHEVHRVWVVEAHVAPGKRHIEPVRRFYVDEDTFLVLASEAYDDQGNLWKYGTNTALAIPDMPGVKTNGIYLTNFQSNNYCFEISFFNAPRPEGGVPYKWDPIPDSRFEQQSMANSGGL